MPGVRYVVIEIHRRMWGSIIWRLTQIHRDLKVDVLINSDPWASDQSVKWFGPMGTRKKLIQLQRHIFTNNLYNCNNLEGFFRFGKSYYFFYQFTKMMAKLGVGAICYIRSKLFVNFWQKLFIVEVYLHFYSLRVENVDNKHWLT